MGDNRGMKQNSTHQNQDAQGLTRVSDAPTSKGKTPSLLVTGKPDRAQRKAENRAKRDAITLQEYARAEIPAGIQIVASALSGMRERQAVNQAAHSLPGVSQLRTAQDRKEELYEGIDQLKGKNILPAGRPSEYTDEEADAVCAWVGEGGSLKAYCRTTGRPMITIYAWMRENASFSTRYSIARKDRAAGLTDEGLDIVDQAAINPSIESVGAAKLRWEARKWIASKLHPEQWGDKQVMEHVGAINISINTKVKPATTILEAEDATPLLR